MLILSRKLNESILIGDDITITVIEVKGKQVRIGILASKDIPVYREEIYKKIQDGKALVDHGKTLTLKKDSN